MNGKERRKEGRKEEVRKWKKKHKRNNFQLKFEIDLSSVMDVLNGKTNSICVQVWVVNKSACLSLSFSFFLSFIFPYLNSLYSVLLLDTSCISRNSTWQENSVCILWWKKKISYHFIPFVGQPVWVGETEKHDTKLDPMHHAQSHIIHNHNFTKKWKQHVSIIRWMYK